MDMNQYLDIFVEESREHLQLLNESLLELEKDIKNKEVLNEIFRVAHTLKGMAGTMGYTKMQHLTHAMEDVLDALRNDRIVVDSDMVDVLFQCLDALETYVNTIAATAQEGSESFSDIVDSLKAILGADPSSAGKSAKHAKSSKGSAKATSLSVALNQYDFNVINKAFEGGYNVFEIRIVLSEGCLLKAARAFIVFQNLEKIQT